MPFQADAKNAAVDDGVWTQFEDAKFKIAHTSNLKFQRALARNQQPHLEKIRSGKIDAALNRKLLCKSMAEGILLDWEAKGVNGEDVPYTTEAGAKALEYQPDFRDFVSSFSMELTNYLHTEAQETGEA